MLELLAATIVSQSNASEQINKFCAYVVGIPYASDNFTDEEWERFVFCREHLKIETNETI
jgi:hypothetical protein